jgi:diguanylate cyclase (GGDEF)-like protein
MKINVLLVEDNPGDARLMQEMLVPSKFDRAYEFSITRTDRLQSALEKLAEESFQILLLDLYLPDSSGLESLRLMRSRHPQLPIIVLTGTDDEKIAFQAVQEGAQDFLIKGQVDGQLLVRSMRYAIERKRLGERLQYMATHDLLTDLPNRQLFQDRLTHSIAHALRCIKNKDRKSNLAVMMLDLDSFKKVNDTLGHAVGDLLLQEVAERLKGCLRGCDTIARFGGDEFTLILDEIGPPEDCALVATRILDSFSKPFFLDVHELKITASIGISLFPRDGKDEETLLRCADEAMYKAKAKSNCFCYYQAIEKTL